MAASHGSLVVVDRPDADVRRIVSEVAKTLMREHSWRRKLPSGVDGETLVVGINWRSWGEFVTIEPEPGSIRVRSRCSFPLQIVDWGKNEWNVDLVRECLKRACDSPGSA
ncbi:MAG: hypothetical protein ACYS0K_24325 [Planctomycetota bacterium]